MLRAIRVELVKLFHTPGGIVGTLLIAIFTAWMNGVTATRVANGELPPAILEPQHIFTLSLSIMAFFGPMLISFVGAVIIGQEFRYGTWRSLLTQGKSRFYMAGAKIGALFVSALVWIGLAMAVGWAIGSAMKGAFILPGISRAVLLQATTIGFSLLFWGLVSFTVAATFRSSTAGVVVGLSLPWIETVLGNTAAIRPWLPFWNHGVLSAAAFANTPRGVVNFSLDALSPTTATALTNLVIELAIILVAGGLILRRSPQ